MHVGLFESFMARVIAKHERKKERCALLFNVMWLDDGSRKTRGGKPNDLVALRNRIFVSLALSGLCVHLSSTSSFSHGLSFHRETQQFRVGQP
jgi:hypothetical protein